MTVNKFLLNKEKEIKFNTFIGPWALPNEEIPAHIIWNVDFEFDSIKIFFPENIKFFDILNVGNYHKTKNTVSLFKNEIKRIDFPKYFGFIVAYTSIDIDKLKIFKDIKIVFYKDDKIIYKIILTAKIFRPKLVNKSEIDPIILTDGELNFTIPLNLECRGFGFIDIRLKALINKVEFSIDQNVIERVKENLEKKYSIITESYEKVEDKKIQINKKSLNNFFKALDKYIKMLNHLEESNENNGIKKEKIKKKITEFLDEKNVEFEFINDFFLELLDQIVIRNKFENILMRDPYLEIPNEKFNEFIEKIIISVNYHDLNGNEYEDLKIPLIVKDLRIEPKKTKINFKIDIENIKNYTFTNVEQIGRE